MGVKTFVALLSVAAILFFGALWFPEIAQIRNPHLVRALKSSLITAGVIFKENTEITDLVISNGRVTGLNSSDGQLSCNKVILASGAWSDQLLEGLNSRIDVRPIRGQMILFKTKPKTVLRIVLSRDRYVIPRRDGRVLVGSTLEDVGFNKDTTEEAKLALLEAGTRLIPQLAEYPIERHWAGLRPGSTTGIPYIGPFPSIQGIYVNTGHFRNGVVLAPASARLMADISLGNTPILDPAPYAVQNISKP